MQTSTLQTREPFSSLFPVAPAVFGAIAEDMRLNGFDEAHPIILWKEGGCVLDGHTRLAAALECGIADVPVVERSIATDDEAVAYAIRCQRNRRNITDADIVRWVAEFDKRKMAGRPAKLPPHGGNILPPRHDRTSATQAAETLGLSTRKYERARQVVDQAPEEIRNAVAAGAMTINAAVNALKPGAKSKPQKAPNKPPKRYIGSDASTARVQGLIREIYTLLDKLAEERPETEGRFYLLSHTTAFIQKIEKLRQTFVYRETPEQARRFNPPQTPIITIDEMEQ